VTWEPVQVNELLERMVRRLVELEPLSEPWQHAFRRVRRDQFLDDFYLLDEASGEWRPVRRAEASELWWQLVYSPETALVTSLDPEGLPASSSTMPLLMARFLELLAVEDGVSVLEIGTGTGYNAALLCERLGSSSVTTVEVDPDLARLAGERLRRAGYAPTAVTADGVEGYPPRAPYDRIIATCAVPRLPRAWWEQLSPRGLIVTPLAGGRIGRGPLVALRRRADGSLVGRFHQEAVSFMWLRSPTVDRSMPFQATTRPPEVRRVELPEWLLDWRRCAAADLFARMEVGDLELAWVERRGEGRERALAGLQDGSWARLVPDGDGHLLLQAGPRRLWEVYLGAVERWSALGRPGLGAYGLTVTTAGDHEVWLGEPQSQWRWRF